MIGHPPPGDRSDPSRHSLARWGAGLALSASLSLCFIVMSLYQLTGEAAAKPALRDALNALVEGDAVIARNYDDLRARAEAAEPAASLEIRDYPIAIPLSGEEVLVATREDISAILLERGTERLYDDGTGVLRDDDAGLAGRFTAAGAADEFLGFLRSGVHVKLGVLTLVLAGISVGLAMVLAMLCHGFGRAVAIGAAVLVASLPLLLGGLAAYAYARASGDAGGEYLRREFMQIVKDLAWLPVRNGIAIALVGAAVVAAGAVSARITGARG
jgi:hypothetical protein